MGCPQSGPQWAVWDLGWWSASLLEFCLWYILSYGILQDQLLPPCEKIELGVFLPGFRLQVQLLMSSLCRTGVVLPTSEPWTFLSLRTYLPKWQESLALHDQSTYLGIARWKTDTRLHYSCVLYRGSIQGCHLPATCSPSSAWWTCFCRHPSVEWLGGTLFGGADWFPQVSL